MVVVVEVVVVIGVVTFYLYIEKLRGAQTVRKNTIFSFARATNTRRVRRRSQFSSSRFSGVSAHTPLCVLFSCICMYIYTHRMYERLGFLLDAIFYLHYFRINIYKARKCKKKTGYDTCYLLPPTFSHIIYYMLHNIYLRYAMVLSSLYFIRGLVRFAIYSLKH